MRCQISYYKRLINVYGMWSRFIYRSCCCFRSLLARDRQFRLSAWNKQHWYGNVRIPARDDSWGIVTLCDSCLGWTVFNIAILALFSNLSWMEMKHRGRTFSYFTFCSSRVCCVCACRRIQSARVKPCRTTHSLTHTRARVRALSE